MAEVRLHENQFPHLALKFAHSLLGLCKFARRFLMRMALKVSVKLYPQQYARTGVWDLSFLLE